MNHRLAKMVAELEQVLVEKPAPSSGQLELGIAPIRHAAITVMQPWAWLLAHASEWPDHVQGKTLENRSMPTSYRGSVLIHVSRRWEHVDKRLAELRRFGLVGRGCPEPPINEMRSQLGLVIAVGELVGCRRVGERDPHPWGVAGAWGWLIEKVELVEPFGLRGNTGLWFAPPGTRVIRTARRLELRGLPWRAGLGLEMDPTTGRASTRVGNLVEAARMVLRSGVSSLDYVVELGGQRLRAGELLAQAALEHGEPDTADRMRRHARALVSAPAPATCEGIHG